MTLTTANMGLLQAQGTDNARDYLKTFLAASLASIDAHDHSSTKGVPVKRLANGTFAARPAAGNAGHVYLATDSNRVTWDNGASWIEAVINATTQAISLGGGLTVTAGGLQVTAGNVGVGSAAGAGIGALVAGSPLSGVNQYGFVSEPTITSSATALAIGFESNLQTVAAVFTIPSAIGFHAVSPSKGAGTVITNNYGLLVESQIAGNTNNYGVYVNAPSGGAGNNFGIYNLGGTLLCGSGTTLGIFGTTPTTKQTVSGSKSANAALNSLLAALAAYGLIIDTTT